MIFWLKTGFYLSGKEKEMKIDELLSKVVPEKTIFQRKKDEIPLQMSSEGIIMNISNKRFISQYYHMRKGEKRKNCLPIS